MNKLFKSIIKDPYMYYEKAAVNIYFNDVLYAIGVTSIIVLIYFNY